jgi:hypothetical protein
VTLDQLKAGVVETPVAPSEGAVREGAGSREDRVVKLRIEE